MKFTIAYTFLLLYVIAAILFWGYSLNKQSNQIFKLEKEKITILKATNKNVDFNLEEKKITDKTNRRSNQYWGEGATFLLIILLSAGIVYYSYYRQLSLNKLQQNFMLSITHELKTPIAGIKLIMQTLEKRKLPEEKQIHFIKSAINETNRLDDLCNNILVSTHLENKFKNLHTEEINLNQLVENIIMEFKVRYESIKLNLQLDDQVTFIKGDNTLWKLVLSNLIENARKYSNKEESIDIELKKINGTTFLSVKDKGEGIPDNEKKKIFEKFYRIGSETTRSSKGTGLGLYIVKKIINLYKYDISVKNNTPKGSIFEIEITS